MTHEDIREIAAKAWEEVKPSTDPPFTQCATVHQSSLAYKVENVAKSGSAGDDFERAALAILTRPVEAPSIYIRVDLPPIEADPVVVIPSEVTPPEVKSIKQPKPKAKK